MRRKEVRNCAKVSFHLFFLPVVAWAALEHLFFCGFICISSSRNHMLLLCCALLSICVGRFVGALISALRFDYRHSVPKSLERSTSPTCPFYFSHIKFLVLYHHFLFSIFMNWLPLGQYHSGPISFVTDHDHSLCMSAPIDALSDIPMFFLILLLFPDLPWHFLTLDFSLSFSLPSFVTYSQPSHEYCRESYYILPSPYPKGK